MYWAILIIANIPVYLFIGWLIFDTKDKAAENIFETIVLILKAIFIPRIVRVFMDDDDEGDGVFSVLIFFAVCIAITIGEHACIDHFFGNAAA